MNNSKFAEFKKDIKAYYTEYYDQYNGVDIDISNNNLVLQNCLENFNEIAEYYNTVQDGHILNDFKDQYGDMQLKDSSVKKLLDWLKNEDLMLTFEHDFIIDKGDDYYMSKNACLMYKEEEPCECLEYWLDGEKLTDLQKSTIENELISYINSDQTYLYIHCISFEFTLPKKAILSAYADYKRGQR